MAPPRDASIFGFQVTGYIFPKGAGQAEDSLAPVPDQYILYLPPRLHNDLGHDVRAGIAEGHGKNTDSHALGHQGQRVGRVGQLAHDIGLTSTEWNHWRMACTRDFREGTIRGEPASRARGMVSPGNWARGSLREMVTDRYPRNSYTLATKLHAGFLKTKEDRDRIFKRTAGQDRRVLF